MATNPLDTWIYLCPLRVLAPTKLRQVHLGLPRVVYKGCGYARRQVKLLPFQRVGIMIEKVCDRHKKKERKRNGSVKSSLQNHSDKNKSSGR
jgi:hypothetical protein